MPVSRRIAVALAAVAMLMLAGMGLSAHAADMVVYKSPWCGCCAAWVAHLRDQGFDVTVEEHEDIGPVKTILGVPESLHACHTALIGRYVIEGHVPARDIRRLLREQPDAAGLAVPGMPVGSPGMEQGGHHESYQVVLFGRHGNTVFARY